MKKNINNEQLKQIVLDSAWHHQVVTNPKDHLLVSIVSNLRLLNQRIDDLLLSQKETHESFNLEVIEKYMSDDWTSLSQNKRDMIASFCNNLLKDEFEIPVNVIKKNIQAIEGHFTDLLNVIVRHQLNSSVIDENTVKPA